MLFVQFKFQEYFQTVYMMHIWSFHVRWIAKASWCRMSWVITTITIITAMRRVTVMNIWCIIKLIFITKRYILNLSEFWFLNDVMWIFFDLVFLGRQQDLLHQWWSSRDTKETQENGIRSQINKHNVTFKEKYVDKTTQRLRYQLVMEW